MIPADQSLIQYPCDFPIKVMGECRDDFAQTIVKAVEPHTGPLQAHQIDMRASKQGRYLSLTLTPCVTSREQLDNIYRCLTSHPWVKLVL
jgi:putative lipoic acid-binding regulatory protein